VQDRRHVTRAPAAAVTSPRAASWHPRPAAPWRAARPNKNGPSRAHLHSSAARRRTGVPPARGPKKRKAPRGGFPPTSTRRSERHRRRGRGLEHPTHRGRAFYGRRPPGVNHLMSALVERLNRQESDRRVEHKGEVERGRQWDEADRAAAIRYPPMCRSRGVFATRKMSRCVQQLEHYFVSV